jgi:hypothetical protein
LLAIGFSPPAHKGCSGDCTLWLVSERGKIRTHFAEAVAIYVTKITLVGIAAKLALSGKSKHVSPADGQKCRDSIGVYERLMLST